ncbi:MAG: DMT family transporter [Promethearchaeota archaeon]|nr:MAG: DMT family transporter [Candidatus Lokiarchaeota archaeon]
MSYGFFINALEDSKKGLIFGIIGTLLVGFQPIVANSRPIVLDAHIFAAMTCFIETILFFPLVLRELYHPTNKDSNEINREENVKKILNNWKSNIKTIIVIGFIFGLNQLLFFIGYDLAGAINGSLTQKTTVFFSLIFGYTLLKERVSKRQIIFSIILFIGLIIAITQGQFTEFNFEIMLGVIIMLGITWLWMFGHSITKPIFSRKEVTAAQMVFLRNLLSAIILFSSYLIFFPISNLELLLSPINIFFIVAMGTVYGSGLYCWYKTLSYLYVSKATIMFSLTPVITAFFAVFILNESATLYYLIGTTIVVISIIFIMKDNEPS